MDNWKDSHLAAQTLIRILNDKRTYGKVKTLDELSGHLEGEPMARTLFNELRESSAPVKTIKDLYAALNWLSFINDENERMKWMGEEKPYYPKRPVYYTEPDAIVVTDTDFIPYSEFSTYEDYRIICGVLYARDEKEQYNNIIYSLRKAGTAVYKRISIKAWKDLIELTLNRLIDIQKRNRLEVVRVRVPFYFYDEDLERTIAYYKRAKLVIETLMEDNLFDDSEVEAEEKDSYRVPWMYFAFQRYAIILEEKHIPGVEYVHEEMVRRGLLDPISTMSYSNGYRIHLLGDKNASSTVADDKTERLDGELINRVGVLYCMLYGLVEDKSLLTKIAHFALNDGKPFKERPTSNTEYTYIAHPLERMFDTFEKKGFVEAKLTEYGFPEDTLNTILKDLRK